MLTNIKMSQFLLLPSSIILSYMYGLFLKIPTGIEDRTFTMIILFFVSLLGFAGTATSSYGYYYAYCGFKNKESKYCACSVAVAHLVLLILTIYVNIALVGQRCLSV
jgi:hypothetical protein